MNIIALMALASLPVIPAPRQVTELEGELTLKQSAPLTISGVDAADRSRLANQALRWHAVDATATSALGGISLTIAPGFAEEGYALKVTPDSASITASTPQGLSYGLTTLSYFDGTIPAMEVRDEPLLPYRGMMLDISRHFRDKDFILKQIDAASKLKINNVHLHLTDAAGWRVEIDRYPELTEYAAWRPYETWKEWDADKRYCHRSYPQAHGGYLSKQDIKEIVDYAADRYINIIPEIEMPSHSEEVTATYPQLSCTHDPKGMPDFCVGEEETFVFLQNVLDEVLEMFPSEVIHIGGDEASKAAWKECEKCAKRMKDNNLKDVDELQSYLIHRIGDYLTSKGRRMMGWDEIMEGGLAPNAEVMSWRGTEGGIRAASMGHDAVMAPGAFCYLDGWQDAPPMQPEANSIYTTLDKTYSYNPHPDSISADVKRHIVGVQGNLWCEYIPTAEQAEYQLYPRMFAIAEVGWKPAEERNFKDFRPRAIALADKMRKQGYNTFDPSKEHGNRPGFGVPEQHLARDKKVTYNLPWWNRYPAGRDQALVDGIRGGWLYGDQLWQGYLRGDDQRLDVTIDLGKKQKISYVGADFMQIIGPGVWLPERVEIYASTDGKKFKLLKAINHTQEPNVGLLFKTYDWHGNAKARYIRYVAKASNGCQFTDEIIVR